MNFFPVGKPIQLTLFIFLWKSYNLRVGKVVPDFFLCVL